jgi:hypothetical protein
MKWAAFEETIGSIDEAREILRQLVAKYPMLLEARYYMHSQAQSIYCIYLEYHNVCPIVRIRTPPPPFPQASVPLPPEPKGGGMTHSPAGEGVGAPNSDDCSKGSLVLCLL